MSFKTILVILLYIIFNTQATFIEDYSWRDYDSSIPSDAYKAGIDRDGLPIYIGQVLYDNKLIPGKIHHNKSEIHIEFFQARILNETIKILCTHHPEHFKWIPTKTDQVLSLKDKHHLFEGGYEKTVTTYVGRTKSFDELTVGKVICWPTYCIPLSTVEQGQYHTHDNFEILTYDPKGKIDDNEVEKSTTEKTEAPMRDSWRLERESASPWAYVFLAFGTIALIVIVILLIRWC